MELKKKLDIYFSETPNDELTLTGLVLALDTNKTTLANYQRKPDYKELIDHAKLRIEHSYELSLKKRGRASDIFALKNFGWGQNKFVYYEDIKTLDKIEDIINQLSESEDEK